MHFNPWKFDWSVSDLSLFPPGLLTATVASRIHRAAQPALLYLVPFTLLPLLTMAYLKVHIGRLDKGERGVMGWEIWSQS